MPNKNNLLNPIVGDLTYQQMTTLNVAIGLSNVPTGTVFAWIQAETQSVRWRADGTNPTSSVGQIIAAGATLEYSGSMSAIKFIESTASAKLNITYFR